MRFPWSTFFRLESSHPYWIHLDGGWVIAFDFRSVKMPRLLLNLIRFFLENGLRKDCREMIHRFKIQPAASTARRSTGWLRREQLEHPPVPCHPSRHPSSNLAALFQKKWSGKREAERKDFFCEIITKIHYWNQTNWQYSSVRTNRKAPLRKLAHCSTIHN
jgi:hypothetical protein